jgi:hypothetical protein
MSRPVQSSAYEDFRVSYPQYRRQLPVGLAPGVLCFSQPYFFSHGLNPLTTRRINSSPNLFPNLSEKRRTGWISGPLKLLILFGTLVYDGPCKGLKILFAARRVRVEVPPRAPKRVELIQ